MKLKQIQLYLSAIDTEKFIITHIKLTRHNFSQRQMATCYYDLSKMNLQFNLIDYLEKNVDKFSDNDILLLNCLNRQAVLCKQLNQIRLYEDENKLYYLILKLEKRYYLYSILGTQAFILNSSTRLHTLFYMNNLALN